ncbi:hypothetical protein FHR32_000387 [Streptosporangium album]|uniref:Uncharacterized protein n=1 Tax=Streptosporangium album TaxID=47479 RepID=A0A7W7RQL1_9ACTN|nr:hypothetical protein [Streptosporangium album]MBB4936082.1 hypothetical protein [Streptosporangium album]
MDSPLLNSRQIEHNDAEECSDAKAEKHDKALAAVQRLLKVRGAHSYVVHTHHLSLFGDGRPFPLGKRQRYTPELVVHSDVGWVIATVAIGQRSGCYLVSISQGPNLETVPSAHPEMVANLVLTAQPAAQPGGTA